MYFCFGGIKHDFKLGCRQVIGLDGCLIKNYYKGQLLVVVGVYPNNCMFLIVYAVVKAQRLDTWRWSLNFFVTDFNLGGGEG